LSRHTVIGLPEGDEQPVVEDLAAVVVGPQADEVQVVIEAVEKFEAGALDGPAQAAVGGHAEKLP